MLEMINGGFVITGGGSLIKGIAELGEYVMERPVKVGYPNPFGGMTNVMQNPKFSTVLGLLLESYKFKPNKKNKIRTKSNNEQDLFGRFGESIRNVFKEIF